jgi:hypothetical protein
VRPRSPRYVVTAHPSVEADLEALYALDPAVFDAAEAIIDDLAHGRVRGKELGARHATADLTGLARVKFDVADHRPERFRLVYRETGTTREILAIGLRDQHSIYHAAAARLPDHRP